MVEFDDGSQILIKDDFILLGIEEKNTNFYGENFEIEVFLEEEDLSTNTKKLIPLRFPSPELVESMDNQEFVDYWLDIELDEDIPTEILCWKVSKDDKKSLYVRKIFTCPDEFLPGEDMEIDIYEDDDLGDAC